MKKKTEFSKSLLIQETVLIWIITIAFIVLAYICITNGYVGELPWLSPIVALPWGAYGVSQACYYKKAQAENTANGIKFETTMAEMNKPSISEDNDEGNDA